MEVSRTWGLVKGGEGFRRTLVVGRARFTVDINRLGATPRRSRQSAGCAFSFFYVSRSQLFNSFINMSRDNSRVYRY